MSSTDLSRRSVLLGAAAAAASLATKPLAAQAGRPPNILFAIADDWSQKHAGAYGCDWVKTPSFDRVAREGVLFNNCFTSNPKCSPCRATILTGRSSWQLEEAVDHFGIFPAKWPVYPDLLEESGYHVGFTAKGWGPGDFQAGGFKRNPAGNQYSEIRSTPPHSGMNDIDYAANFEAFLQDRADGQPFWFWYGATEPHRPYEDGIGVRAGKDPKDVELPAFYPDRDVIRRDMLDYSIEVEHYDMHLGLMLRKLEELGELENTVVVMTSDHGMPFPRVKGQIYEEGFHLPLAIRWGGMAGGRTIDDFINARDFMPTFLELAGLPIPESVTGESFLPALRSGRSGWIDSDRNRMLVGKERHDLGRPHDAGYPVRALRTPEFLYVRNYEPDSWPAGNPETGYRNVDGGPTKEAILSRFDEWYALSFGKRPAEELYLISEDPDCMRNLALEPAYWETKSRLRGEMEELLRIDGDPRTLGHPEVFDTYRYLGNRTHSYESWLSNQQR